MRRNQETPNYQCQGNHPAPRRKSGQDENHLHSPFGSIVKATDATTSQVVLFRDCEGKVCAGPPDWANDPQLKRVAPADRRAFREVKITEYLETNVPRGECEGLCAYLVRCIAAAENELKRQKKMHAGDDFPHHLDKLVFRLFYGSRIGQHRYGINWPLGTEELVLQLLKESAPTSSARGCCPSTPKIQRPDNGVVAQPRPHRPPRGHQDPS